MATSLSTEDLSSLKELLRDRALPVSGTKAQLIARLQEVHPEQVEQEQAQVESEPQPAPNKRPVDEMQVDDINDDDRDRDLASKRTKTSDKNEAEHEPTIVEQPPAVDVPPASSETTTNGTTDAAQPSTTTTNGAASKDELAEAERIPAQQVLDEENRAEQAAEAGRESDDEEPPEYNFEPEELDAGRPTDMYLDTINRNALDFDFERLCSVTLSHNNIYACLVDGKYFQGRGKSSPAYAHSIGEDHHVFINLETRKVFVLPDGYEVDDPSLADIKYLLNPTFTPDLLSSIDRSLSPHYDLSQTPYYPGFVGLNNIKHNSYMNAVLHSLVHVLPLRDYFILDPLCSSPQTTELVRRFSLFCRKVWNPKAFKGQVSPHELLQEISNVSGGKFKITKSGDPAEFLGWLLNTLHRDLGGNRKPRSSIIHAAFQGEVRVDDQQVLRTGEYGTKPKFDVDREIKTTRTPFLFLTLDLPPPPLFQSHLSNDIIPQVPLSTLLAKYNGSTSSELIQQGQTTLRRYKVEKLPEFVILNVKRFMNNRFGEEKNPTIVNFPLRGVDFSDYVEGSEPMSTYYDLVSNITHTSLAGTAREETQWKTYVHLRPERDENGNYKPVRVETDNRQSSEAGSHGVGAKAQVGNGGEGARLREVKEEDEKWFEMQDLVVQEIEKGLVGLGESYIQIWERRRPCERHEIKVEVPKPKVKGVAGQPRPK
ncbi:hypothetical protein JCM10212_002378 [Sporobolomyces blumeae]